MNALTVFVHAMRLQLRDRLNLAITLLTGTLFVFLYWMMTGGGGSTSVQLLVLDEDRPIAAADGTRVAAGEAVRTALGEVRYPDGQALAVVERVSDASDAEVRLRNREAAALLKLPAGLSTALLVRLAATIPVVGIGLIVACFARTAMRAYLVASVPFMLLMFFSGAVFPMPKIEAFRAAGRVVGVFDFLPTTTSS